MAVGSLDRADGRALAGPEPVRAQGSASAAGPVVGSAVVDSAPIGGLSGTAATAVGSLGATTGSVVGTATVVVVGTVDVVVVVDGGTDVVVDGGTDDVVDGGTDVVVDGGTDDVVDGGTDVVVVGGGGSAVTASTARTGVPEETAKAGLVAVEPLEGDV